MTRWYTFRRSISFRSRLQFHYYMSERDYNGKLVFDHDNGHLILAVFSLLKTKLSGCNVLDTYTIYECQVQPSQQAGDGKRQTNTLSGGEKSFSQICLLLALWDAMGSPFRCLDELWVVYALVIIITTTVSHVCINYVTKPYIVQVDEKLTSIIVMFSWMPQIGE